LGPRVGSCRPRSQEDSLGADDEQAPDVSVPLAADPAQALLPAGRPLPRHEPEPRRELASTAEDACIRNSRRDRRGDQRSDAGYGREPLADRVGLVSGGDLALEVLDPPLRLVQLGGEEPEDLPRHLRDLALDLQVREHPVQVPGALGLDDAELG
jgi:hypothetical protein